MTETGFHVHKDVDSAELALRERFDRALENVDQVIDEGG